MSISLAVSFTSARHPTANFKIARQTIVDINIFHPSALPIAINSISISNNNNNNNTMVSSILFVIVACCLAFQAQAFAPIIVVSSARSRSSSASTELDMAGKKAKEDDIPDFLKGRGARITIRQDEDNAMWVEEPKAKKPNTPAKKAPPAKSGKAAAAAAPEKKKGPFGLW
jgi:hypothetical protein